MESNEWKEYRFSELVEIIGGGTPKTNVEKYWNGDIPWLSVKDFNSDNRKIYYTEKTITKEGLKNSSTNLLEEGDLIISARGTVGALAQLGRPMAFNQSCYGLKAKKITSNDFIYYLLKYKIREIKQNIHGSVFDTITRNTFDVLTAKIPNIKEQKAIANILSTLDEKIETNNKINKKLEEMAQALFKHWFVDFEFPDENGKPYKSSGGEMVDSELGMIPRGWEVKKIVDLDIFISDYVANGSFKTLKDNVNITDSNGYAVFIRNTDLKSKFASGMKFVDKHSYDFLAKTKLYGNEVIISNVGDVGSVYLCPNLGRPMTLGNNVILLKSEKDPKENYFYYRLFKSNLGQHLISTITSGSVQLKFNKTDFRNLKIIYPNRNLLEKYLDLESSIEKKIQLNNKESSKLINIRNAILPKLMSGEIRVPLDEDELVEQNS